MRDIDIRKALHTKIKANHHADPSPPLVLHEVGLCQGHVRLDVAVLNGSLEGYEIKSAGDTLERLPAQERIYSRTLKSVTIVASERHLSKIRTMVPKWWGIFAARDKAGSVELSVIRAPRPNPSVDPRALVQLLWRDEAFEILRERDLDHGLSSKPRAKLWDKLVEHLSLEELQTEVYNRLKARQSKWRSARPRPQGGGSFQPSAK